ncbi:6437_t:CDS:1, partial [Racocetra persica]
QAAQKSVKKCQAISHNKNITEIKALLSNLNQEQLDNIYKILMKEQEISYGDGELESINKEREFSHGDEISKEKYQKTKLDLLIQ